ncbi:probable adenylate kinase 7 mitochondrial [Phtheirospermum japonicum]|uniref:adenylate kinase n=1 Tax=Phtheirospermum japonicum TaxID=374723 RepID=A0A830BHP3_9LAMI|nr:probable adenylate kinase 7 mitochondrial [Phtheirospermum japonicum]
MTVISRLGIAARLSHRLRRAYGSAAAAQLDYDYYHCYDGEEEPPRGAMEESEEWETPGRGVQWVIMGDPMASRHVYAERLAKLLDVPHISMGSLVRQELNPNSPLYKKIAGAVNQGKLVPEDVIFGLLSNRLEEGYCRGENGFILDGIPRTRMQAEILDQVTDIDLVLNLKCTEESVVKKTLGGRIYSPSRKFHSMAASGLNNLNPFQSPSADSDPIWKEKLHMFAEQLCCVQRKPLEEYYKQQKKLLDFQVAGAPGDTWQCLLAALQLQHMSNAASSPHKLMA